ncbi:RE1 [Symbiodinium sp. CCMP2592]|nr:RE1 [Symbiodinium sp. CCMP2592]
MGGGCIRHEQYMRLFCARTCNFCDRPEDELQVSQALVAGELVGLLKARGVRRWTFFELPVINVSSCPGGPEESVEDACAASAPEASLRSHVASARFYDSLSHDLNSSVYRWQPGSSSFELHQALPTRGAWALTSFRLSGEVFLAVASFFDGASRKLSSRLYRWDVGLDMFVWHQDLATEGAKDVEFLRLSDSLGVLAFAENSANDSVGECRLFLWRPAQKQFELLQVLATSGASDVEAFEPQSGEKGLLVVHEELLPISCFSGSPQSGDVGVPTGTSEPDYQAALSQEDSEQPSASVRFGEMSPGTLEQGGVSVEMEVPTSRLAASPFHSDKVKSEIELLNSRPATLDNDGREPDYSITGPGLCDGVPRLARVEMTGAVVGLISLLLNQRLDVAGKRLGRVVVQILETGLDLQTPFLVSNLRLRLALDPSTVVASYDLYKYQRVEELITNRWMSSAAILYRILCVYQPGGSMDLIRAREVQATLPDPSLLLKGIALKVPEYVQMPDFFEVDGSRVWLEVADLTERKALLAKLTEVTTVYSLSVDIAGPFKEGRSFDPISSGRDRGRGYKYFIAAAYSVPLNPELRPVLHPSEDLDEYSPSECEPEIGSAGPIPAEISEDFDELLDRLDRQATGAEFAQAGELEGASSNAVMGQVQALVNRLESFGYPVHRYFADRAKELRSHSLIQWFRERGVHASFTAGEDPAGNKAEVGVQHLKQDARKLLRVADLPTEFWPFAVLHVSQRNFVQLAEALGVGQAVLLPFGTLLHARKRLKTGHKKHWEARTVPGKYLGVATDCAGGHLVLIQDGSEQRVLLTNTVYPVDGSTGHGVEIEQPEFGFEPEPPSSGEEASDCDFGVISDEEGSSELCIDGATVKILSGVSGTWLTDKLEAGVFSTEEALEDNGDLVRYLNKFVRAQGCEHPYTTLYLSRDASTPLHQDARNERIVPVWVIALGEFQGGGLWVEGSEGQGPVLRQLPGGDVRAGFVRDIHDNPYVFSGQLWHCAEPWCGKDRWVIAAYAPRGAGKILDKYIHELEDDAELGCDVEREGAQCLTPEVSWEVEFPREVLKPGWREHALRNHLTSAITCKALSKEISSSGDDGVVCELFRTLKSVECQRDWYEGLLWDDFVQNSGSMLKALNRDVPLNPGDQASPAEVFLQTRTVSLAEAKGELTLWIPSANEEVVSLEQTNEAVERIVVADIERLIQEGRKVTQVPGKAVLTRKAGVGKRRFRCVACGNYIPTGSPDSNNLYASGVESLTVRTAISYAAYRDWSALSADIRTAFLHAPLDGELEAEEVIIVRPPSILVEMKILLPNHRWRVRKALYGLRQAPLAWARFRDKSLRTLTFQCDGTWYALQQGISDDSLWFIVKRETAENDTGRWHGILIIYVDDLLGFSTSPILSALFDEIQKLWKLSDPEWIREEAATKFCGLEIQALKGGGFRISQVSYLQELFARYDITSSASAPLSHWADPEDEQQVQLETIRNAQAMTGALLWASSKSRPDVAFAVSKLGQFAVKAPSLVIESAYQVLRYLYGTADLWLEYQKPGDNSWVDTPVPRTLNTLELYSDASHAPGGGRSCQAIVILWGGNVICWESSRQPFVTLSSAEAELVALTTGFVAAESVGGIIEEMTESDITISALCDNQAAARSFSIGSQGWRNRHLRMRAASGRERIELGSLVVTYVPGSIQLADIATKALARTRILELAELMNMRSRLLQTSADDSIRVVSRLSLSFDSSGAVSPRTLAGLALVAVLSGAEAQPSSPVDERLGWALWALGFMIGLILVAWAQWFFDFGLGGFGNGEQPQTAAGQTVGLETSEASAEVPRDAEVFQGLNEAAQSGSEGAESDQFSEAEWLKAQRKLQDQEIKTGLTFIQRVRLRRQIAAGGLVEPPVMMERFGSLPDWMTSAEQQPLPLSNHQVGGSSGSGDVPVGMPVAVWSLSVGDFVFCSRFLVVFLGSQAREWHCMRGVARAYRRSAVLCVICGLQDTGAAQANETGVPFHATYQWDQVEGGFRWVPLEFEVGDEPSQEPSSGAAELAVSPLDYEDLFEHEANPVFPYVGDFVHRHFLIVLLSVEGGRILDWFEGGDVAKWLICSNFCRVAIVCAAAERRRLLPGGIIYEGYDGLMLVQEAILSGAAGNSGSQQFPPCPNVQIGGSSSSQQFPPCPNVQIGGSSSSQQFPPCPNVQIGGSSSSQQIPEPFDAAFAYLQGDVEEPPAIPNPFDLEDDPTIDDRPHRDFRPQSPRIVPIFYEAGWSSSESGDSTTEPSVDSVSSSDAAVSEDVWVIRDADARMQQVVEPQALGANFHAEEGVLIGTFVDDEVTIPFQGWSQAEVETIVTGLNEGDWASYHAMMAQTGDQGSQTTLQVPSSQGAGWVVSVGVALGLVGVLVQDLLVARKELAVCVLRMSEGPAQAMKRAGVCGCLQLAW